MAPQGNAGYGLARIMDVGAAQHARAGPRGVRMGEEHGKAWADVG